MGIHGHLDNDVASPFTARDALLEEALHQRLDGVNVEAESPNYAACGDEPIRWPRRMHEPPQCQRVHIALHDGSRFSLIIPMPPMRGQVYPPPVWSALLLFALVHRFAGLAGGAHRHPSVAPIGRRRR